MKNHLFQNAGLLLLRVGIGVVFIIFGFDKLIHPNYWEGWIPEGVGQWWEEMHLVTISPFLKIQGVVEGVLGIFLVLGLWTRRSAFLCSAILVGIVYFWGLDPVGIRDIGLLGSCLALFCLGGGEWSLDKGYAKICRKK